MAHPLNVSLPCVLSIVVLNFIGACYRLKGEPEYALPFLIQCLLLDSNHEYAWGNLAICLHQLGYNYTNAFHYFGQMAYGSKWSINHINQIIKEKIKSVSFQIGLKYGLESKEDKILNGKIITKTDINGVDQSVSLPTNKGLKMQLGVLSHAIPVIGHDKVVFRVEKILNNMQGLTEEEVAAYKPLALVT